MSTKPFVKGWQSTTLPIFCPKLQKSNPVLVEETVDYWLTTYIVATPLCYTLLDKYSPQKGDTMINLCVPLIEEVEALFE